MHMRNAVVILAVTAATVHAQTPPQQPMAPKPPKPPKNDMTISLGWFGGQYPALARYNRWHQSLFSGAAGGHYWTDHFKSEVEAQWLSRVSTDSYETQTLVDGFASVRTSYRFRDARLSLSQLYQFGENAWVHPYLGAGADVNYLRAAEDRPAQIASVYGPGRPTGSIVVSKFSEQETSVRARPFVRGGFKMYASDRVFFTTEWKCGLGSLKHLLWKTGVGVDF